MRKLSNNDEASPGTAVDVGVGVNAGLATEMLSTLCVLDEPPVCVFDFVGLPGVSLDDFEESLILESEAEGTAEVDELELSGDIAAELTSVEAELEGGA
jgi:hypothetical protein